MGIVKQGDILISHLKLIRAAIRCQQLKELYYAFTCPRLTYMELYLWAKEVRN